MAVFNCKFDRLQKYDKQVRTKQEHEKTGGEWNGGTGRIRKGGEGGEDHHIAYSSISSPFPVPRRDPSCDPSKRPRITINVHK